MDVIVINFYLNIASLFKILNITELPIIHTVNDALSKGNGYTSVHRTNRCGGKSFDLLLSEFDILFISVRSLHTITKLTC